MKLIIKFFTLIILVLTFTFASSSTVSAALPPLPSEEYDCAGFLNCLGSIRPDGLKPQFWSPSGEGFIGLLVTAILPIVIGIAGFIAVALIIISGIQFASSSGNPEAAAAARGRLIFSLIGFGIVALAFALTQIIDAIFLNSGAL